MAMSRHLPGALSRCSVEDVVAGTLTGTALRDTCGEVILWKWKWILGWISKKKKAEEERGMRKGIFS